MNGGERRKLIEKAATHLFAQHGFSSTTTKEIAAAAGVSEATIYTYFGTKSELYNVILEAKIKEIFGGLKNEIKENMIGKDDECFFQTIAVKIVERCRADYDFLRLMLYSKLENRQLIKQFYRQETNPIFEFICSYIELRQRENAFQQCDSAQVAQGFIAAQIHFAATGMLAENIFTNIPESKAILNFTRLTIDGLRHRTYDKIF